MVTEDVIKEIVSMMCLLHRGHPTVEINKEGQINISVCCDGKRSKKIELLSVQLHLKVLIV